MKSYRVNKPAETGQDHLLDDAPCDCDPSKFIRDLTPLALTLQNGNAACCYIARAVSLALIGAAMVNPINAIEEDRAECIAAAKKVADAYEQIARGIRRRVTQ